MEEQVKARLIGATILVVIAVALVPELLSGPRRQAETDAEAPAKRGTRTYTIDLSGGSGAAKPMALPKPSADPAAGGTRLPTVAPPGPAADRGSADRVASEAPEAPVPTVARTAAAPAPAEPVVTPPAAPKPSATTPVAQPPAQGGWAVQVGAFGSAATARNLVAELQGDGYSAYVAPLVRNGKTLHRVRVGPQPVRADAEKLAGRLKARGLPASVVAAQ
jgi:cell division septation protein DedD